MSGPSYKDCDIDVYAIAIRVARYGKDGHPGRIVPKISYETLAEMVGTTRPHISL